MAPFRGVLPRPLPRSEHVSTEKSRGIWALSSHLHPDGDKDLGGMACAVAWSDICCDTCEGPGPASQ